MATQYEFKELERQITTLEKDLAKFEDSFASTISTISNARFNENEYGERAITKKVSEIVDRAKRKISSIFNDYVNGIRRASFESAKTVKNAANDTAAYIEKLNSRLKILDSLNSAFSEKRYRFILQTDIKSEDFSAEISKTSFAQASPARAASAISATVKSEGSLFLIKEGISPRCRYSLALVRPSS